MGNLGTSMDDAIARNIIWAVMFATAWALVALIRRLWRSPSEGARRLRWVVGLLIALPIMALLAHDLGVGGTLIAVAALAAIVWVIKGFKTKS